jgi:uncharacterized phiE125 gp8 family phage protein
MPLTLVRTSDPSKEPLTLIEAKSHLRVDTSDNDVLISDLIKTAREHVEETTGRALITQTWELSLDDFPWSTWFESPWEPWIRHGEKPILLPRSPLQSVSSISYVDTDGATQTLAASKYRVDTKSEPARITEAEGEIWPSTDRVTNSVTVTYVAGYGDNATDIPAPIRQAMKLMLEIDYDRPDPSYTGVIRSRMDALLAPYRVKV